MHNDNDSNKRKKSESKLVITRKIKEQFQEALMERSEIEIMNSFTAYIDNILTEKHTVKKILPYFLTYKEEEYPVIDNFLENFNLNYSIVND